jgi:hypothetical protein
MYFDLFIRRICIALFSMIIFIIISKFIFEVFIE